MKPDGKLDFRLLLVTNRHLTTDIENVVRVACQAGVRAVQLREKDLSGRELYELAQRLREITRGFGARLFVNDRVDIALAVRADGIQCPENGIPSMTARRLLGDEASIGVSTHSLSGVLAAENTGASFVTFGPVFDTAAKRPYGPPQGLSRLTEVCGRTSLPVFAIGGIHPENGRSCFRHGAAGVALISAIVEAEDVGARVEAFADALGGL